MLYLFESFTLDVQRHELSKNGEPVKLTGLSFRMLKSLLEAAPALVTHDELIDQVWGANRVITPENLLQRVMTLRKSLGDDAQNPRFIEGVRGEGFRMVCPVDVKDSMGDDSRNVPRKNTRFPWPWLVAGVLLGLVLTLLVWFNIDSRPAENVSTGPSASHGDQVAESRSRATVAVLPFANLSQEQENEYFANGIHDDLLSRLSRIADIKTISRTSVMAYRDSDKSLQTIASELGVETILEGGVQRAGNEVRINMQLIDAQTDASLWSQSYTRELSAASVFAIQTEITESVVDVLQAILTEEEQARIQQQPTANLAALEAYYLGTNFFRQATSEGYDLAILAFKRAIELDPGFAAAYSMQAQAMLNQIWYLSLPLAGQLEKSWPLIETAIELDPLSSDAYNALGTWMKTTFRYEEAESAYRKSIALGPSNAIAYADYGNFMQWSRFDGIAAIDLYRQAIELDPQNIGHKTQLAESLDYVGRGRQAIQLLESTLDQHPDFANTHRVLAGLYSWVEFRQDKAIRSALRAHELDPDQQVIMEQLSQFYWKLGLPQQANDWGQQVAENTSDPHKALFWKGVSLLYIEDIEGGLEVLKQIPSESPYHWAALVVFNRMDLALEREAEVYQRMMQFEVIQQHASDHKVRYGWTPMIDYVSVLRWAGEEEDADTLAQTLSDRMAVTPRLGSLGYQFWDAALAAVTGDSAQALALATEWVEAGGASQDFLEEAMFGFSSLVGTPEFEALLNTVEQRLQTQRQALAESE